MADLLRRHGTGAERLRELLADPEVTVAPGVYDALSARFAEAGGAGVVYMTGFGVAASRLGRPDVGLLTMTEMVSQAKAIANAVDVPLIADADTGYGNPINVIRTVQEYEQAGVAGIQLEDQSWPKKCGHMADKTVIAAEEMARKIEAAVAARENPDTVLIARTDAIAPLGYDEAIRRARMYRDAGADVLFVEALRSEEQMAQARADLTGADLLFNWVEGGKSPMPDVVTLKELGFALAIYPISGLLSAARALQETYASVPPVSSGMQFSEFTEAIGLDEILRLNARFA
ncbi:isocitrate lyase/PEP mutase family protein [Microbacterium sp. ET2]|uniref:isocitrate lyase/PEP mutase family protein n=1 Tax=Microbacterium albipurpureum TaxID=3050384 RepID=UPI00259CCD7A|nr:isocitrate lyase/PEP mutase family protein [Microbacterium sp. ET2 (Ac-2212)]WJL96774.1 isocitrate lyase/PEP mutase family protein [Microbacterium sp. ET2 (Ac-2212)]